MLTISLVYFGNYLSASRLMSNKPTSDDRNITPPTIKLNKALNGTWSSGVCGLHVETETVRNNTPKINRRKVDTTNNLHIFIFLINFTKF